MTEKFRIPSWLGACLGCLIFAGSVLGAIYWFQAIPYGRGLGPSTELSTLEVTALTTLNDIVDRGLAVDFGLLALFGAAMLGFQKSPALDRLDTIAAVLALNFFVLSALAGVFVKIKTLELMINKLAQHLYVDRVQTPLMVQLLALVFGLAAIGWLIGHRAFKQSGWTGEKS